MIRETSSLVIQLEPPMFLSPGVYLSLGQCPALPTLTTGECDYTGTFPQQIARIANAETLRRWLRVIEIRRAEYAQGDPVGTGLDHAIRTIERRIGEARLVCDRTEVARGVCELKPITRPVAQFSREFVEEVMVRR